MDPLVSLVVPTFNHEKYVSDFISSILNIKYKNIELIVTDDCSSDKTFNIFNDNFELLKKKFVNIILNRNEINKGIPSNINGILNYVKGKYIKIIATDDILLSDSIKSLVNFYEHNQDAVFIYANAYIVNNDFDIKKDDLKFYKTIYNKKQDTINLFYEKLMLKNMISAPTVMIKKSTLDEFGKFDENCFCEDIPYWLKISYGRIVKYLDKPVVCYRKTIKPIGYELDYLYCKKMYDENSFILNTYINKIKNKKYRKKIIISRLTQLFLYKNIINNNRYNEEFLIMCKKYSVSSLKVCICYYIDYILNKIKKLIKIFLRLEYVK